MELPGIRSTRFTELGIGTPLANVDEAFENRELDVIVAKDDEMVVLAASDERQEHRYGRDTGG